MGLITFYKEQEESIGSNIDWLILQPYELSGKAPHRKPSPQFLQTPDDGQSSAFEPHM